MVTGEIEVPYIYSGLDKIHPTTSPRLENTSSSSSSSSIGVGDSESNTNNNANTNNNSNKLNTSDMNNKRVMFQIHQPSNSNNINNTNNSQMIRSTSSDDTSSSASLGPFVGGSFTFERSISVGSASFSSVSNNDSYYGTTSSPRTPRTVVGPSVPSSAISTTTGPTTTMGSSNGMGARIVWPLSASAQARFSSLPPIFLGNPPFSNFIDRLIIFSLPSSIFLALLLYS